MLPKEYALPGPQREFVIHYRYNKTGRRERRFYMRRHIIRPFRDMGVQGIIFRHQSIQPVFQISSCRWVVVFLNQQTRGSMLNKQSAQPLTQTTTLNFFLYGRRNIMQALLLYLYLNRDEHDFPE